MLKKIRYFYLLPRELNKRFFIYLNRWILKINDVEFGRNVRLYNNFYLLKHMSAHIRLGDNFSFSSGSCFNPLSRNIKGSIYAGRNACICIGNNVGVSSACIWAANSIIIGNNVKIGSDSIILDTDCHSLDYIKRRSTKTDIGNSAPIYIGDDVMIGTRCIILKGVTIGERTIIGSGSIVTKSIPSDCIAAGNPCKVIKKIENN